MISDHVPTISSSDASKRLGRPIRLADDELELESDRLEDPTTEDDFLLDDLGWGDNLDGLTVVIYTEDGGGEAIAKNLELHVCKF